MRRNETDPFRFDAFCESFKVRTLDIAEPPICDVVYINLLQRVSFVDIRLKNEDEPKADCTFGVLEMICEDAT